MAGELRHKHHLSTMLNLIASLADPSEDDPGDGINRGQFRDNFGDLILSSLPEIATAGAPSSSYLNALSAIAPETARGGGVWEQGEIQAAMDDLQRRVILYHLANLELLAPADPLGPEVQQRHWEELLHGNDPLIPTLPLNYKNLIVLDQIQASSTGLTEAARLHGPRIALDMAKVARSMHPGILESKQAPTHSVVFHCQDDITSARATHPVTLLDEMTSNLYIPPCTMVEELQRPLMERLKNLIMLMLISSSMASIAQAVLLLRAATLVATKRCEDALEKLDNFSPSARLANLNDEITLTGAPMSDEYRELIKTHSTEFTSLKRGVLNAAAEMRQLLLNKDACASLTLHRMLCGSSNFINFSTLLGALLFLPRTDPDMIAIMGMLQDFANAGFDSEGITAEAPNIAPLVRAAQAKFATFWSDTPSSVAARGPGISTTGVADNPSSYAFNLLQKALATDLGKAKTLAEKGLAVTTTCDETLCNLTSLRDSIDSNIVNLDSHLMARNNENCPISLEYSTTRSTYQDSVREQLLNTISRLTRAKAAEDVARSNRDNIFAHTAPRWESMKFSGFRKDWVPFRREFRGLFRDFQGDDIYVMRQLVKCMEDKDLRELVREKDTLEEAMDFLERRFENADDEVTRLLTKFDTIPKPLTRRQELPTYLKLESLKRRLAQAGGDDLMSRFATRKVAERVLSQKVWERFIKKQSDLKQKKRDLFMEENEGLFTKDKVITLQNANKKGLELTHKEAYDIFWRTVEEAIYFIESTGYVANIDDRIFGRDNPAGDGGNGAAAAPASRGNRRRGAFNNMARSPAQNHSEATWGGAADAAASSTRGNGATPTGAAKQVHSGAGAAKATRTLPVCRLKPCQDLGGQSAQHTLFLCPIVQGLQPAPAPIGKLLKDSNICAKCARYLTECGGRCNGQYTLRSGATKSGLCQEGCAGVNRMFCTHSKLYNSPKNNFKGTPQNLAAMHTAGEVINDLLHNQDCSRAEIEELAAPPASGASLSWTVASTVEAVGQAFDVLNTAPLNQDPFRDNSQLTDLIKVCANVPGALVFMTRCLLDTGADVSYLCSAFARQLGLRPIPLPRAFDLPTAGGGYSLITHYYILKIVREHDDDILIKVHGVDDLTRRYSAMHLTVPKEVLKQFNVQPSHFSQASGPISLILGSDVWRFLSPVELKRTSEYLLYRSVISNNLLLAGARRSMPQNTASQFTLLSLNNMQTDSNDLFQNVKTVNTSIAKFQHKLSQAAAPLSTISNREYLDIREQQLHGTSTAPMHERVQVPLHPMATEYTGRSRSPWPVLQQRGVVRPRDLHPALRRPGSRVRRKTVTFNDQVVMHTPFGNIVTIPLEDDKYTLGMVAFHQGSVMKYTGSLFSLQIRGDLWAHDNSAPVKSFFDKYGVNFNIPFAPIRDCEKCSRLCEECKVLSSKLDPNSLLEYTMFYKQTTWSEEEKKWYCNPVFNDKKLQLLGDGSQQVMHRMTKLDQKVARLEQQDRESLNDCVTKAIECGALKVAAELPILEGFQKWHIPMGYVSSESTSTPMRAVWDNGFKVHANSVSLNDAQLTGPNLCSLFRCACYIRSFRYFSSLDIRKSFWNLHVGPASMSLHRVFIKVLMVDGLLHSVLGHKEGVFTEFVMTTLSFGDKAATAHLAVALAKGLVKFGVEEQLARQLLLFVYVDNCHLASNNLEELKAWEEQTDKFFSNMNWATHSWIRSYELQPPVTSDHAKPENSIVKLLGVYHDIAKDKFSVTFGINLGKVSRNKKLSPDLKIGEDPLQYILLHGMSRRTALRISGSIFCYSGHCITLQVASRLCFRQAIIWNPQSSWDQQLTMQTKEMYSVLFSNILACSGHSWDRCWLPKESDMEKDGIHPYLVAHCDGSLEASATKIFIISKPIGSKMRQASLVCARAQVAPVKQMLSVPQLELNSIWLAARAVEEIKQNFEIKIYGAVVLTDSETSFHWTQASPNFLQKYSANKVKVIQSILDVKKVFHIASRFNLADTPSKYQAVITKESMTAEMQPGFMRLHRSEWPTVRLTPSSKDLPDVLDKYRSMGVDIFSQPALAIMPQTICQAGEDPKHVVQAFNLEPRLMSLQLSTSFYDRSCILDSEYQDAEEAMDDYRLNFGPDFHCSVVMPEDTLDRFLATECLEYHEPDHALNSLLRKGFKPLVHAFIAKKGKDHGRGWLKHAWKDEIPQIKERLKTEDPEFFADVLLAHTSLDKVIRIVALCIRFGRRCRRLEGRDEQAPLQKHFITAHMMLHRMATSKVKFHLSSQVLSERFFMRDGILRVFNRRFKNKDTEFAETSIVLSARTALGICTLLDCHYRRGGHLTSPMTITGKLRASSPSIYAPFATKLLQSIEDCCIFCRMKKVQTARPVQGMVAPGKTAVRSVFKHVVLDGAGPWMAIRGQGAKQENFKLWSYIWTCLGTGLIHITVAEDLTAAQVLLGLNELNSTYGKVRTVHCDGQSAFRSLAKQHSSAQDKDPGVVPDDERQNAAVTTLQMEALRRHGVKEGVTFKFGAPRAAHYQAAAELGIGALKKLLYMQNIAFIAPEVREILKKSKGDKQEFKLVETILDCSGLTVLQYQALWKRIAATLNRRPWHITESGTFSRWDLLHPRDDDEGTDKEIMEPVLLDKSDKAFQQLEIIEAALAVVWQRYTQYLVSHLAKGDQARWPSLDANEFKPGTVVLFRDRVLKQGRLDLGVVQSAVEPAPGDAQRRYLVRSAHKRHKSTHPFPIASDSVAHSILERDASSLIRLGHSEDKEALFFDPRVLRDDFTPEDGPSYPGQDGGSPFSPTPPLVYTRGKRKDPNRFGTKHTRTGTPAVTGRPSTADLRTPAEKESGVLPVYKVRQDIAIPQVQGRAADPDPGQQPQLESSPRNEGLYADDPGLEGDEGESLLPRDMSPPPELNEILTTVSTPGDGNRLFLAVASSMMIQREGVNQDQIPVRRRNSLAKLIRKQAFQHGITLTLEPEARRFFGFLLEEGQELEEMLSELREVLESFVDKEKQQAVPAKFSEQFNQLPIVFPQLLAMATGSPIFIFTSGSTNLGNLERVDGFRTVLGKEDTHPAIVIMFDGLAYNAMAVMPGYADIFKAIQDRMEEEDSYVPQETIQRAIAIVHYLYNHEATREFV